MTDVPELCAVQMTYIVKCSCRVVGGLCAVEMTYRVMCICRVVRELCALQLGFELCAEQVWAFRFVSEACVAYEPHAAQARPSETVQV